MIYGQLTMNQAEAFNYFYEPNRSAMEVMAAWMHPNDIDSSVPKETVFGLTSIPSDDLVKSLANGYEIRKTKKDTLVNDYQRLIQSDDREERYIAHGITKALDALDICIKGINEF